MLWFRQNFDNSLLLWRDTDDLYSQNQYLQSCDQKNNDTSFYGYTEDDVHYDWYFCNAVRDFVFAQLRYILMLMDYKVSASLRFKWGYVKIRQMLRFGSLVCPSVETFINLFFMV